MAEPRDRLLGRRNQDRAISIVRGEHGFFVEQTIPLGGKLRLSRNVFQKTIEQAEAVRDLQRLRILSSVRQTFYSVLLTERRIEVQERLAALASEAVGVTAQLFNVGAADRPDYLEIEIESRRLQLQLNRSRNELSRVSRAARGVDGRARGRGPPARRHHRRGHSRAGARTGHSDTAGAEPGTACRASRARADAGRDRSRQT